MITEKYNQNYITLIDAINQGRKEGFVIEFVTNERGFYDPKKGNTYLPESIRSIEVARIDAPMSGPDNQSIIYLLTTVDNKKGWISDAYGLYANDLLAEHLKRVKENYSCVP